METNFYSETHIGNFFREHIEALEQLRTNPVKIEVDDGPSTRDKLICELTNKGFKFTFVLLRKGFKKEDFKQAMTDILTDLGVAVL
jgi:hypothetical protein